MYVVNNPKYSIHHLILWTLDIHLFPRGTYNRNRTGPIASRDMLGLVDMCSIPQKLCIYLILLVLFLRNKLREDTNCVYDHSDMFLYHTYRRDPLAFPLWIPNKCTNNICESNQQDLFSVVTHASTSEYHIKHLMRHWNHWRIIVSHLEKNSSLHHRVTLR